MIQERPYAGSADYPLMRRLLVETLGSDGPPVYAIVGDLDWWRCAEDDLEPFAVARLWVVR